MGAGGGPGGSRARTPDPVVRLTLIALLAMVAGVCFAIPMGAGLLPRRREEGIVLPGPGWLVQEEPEGSPLRTARDYDFDVDPGGGPSPDGRSPPTEDTGPPEAGGDSAPVREHSSISAAPRGASGPPRGGGGSRRRRSRGAARGASARRGAGRQGAPSPKARCNYENCGSKAYREVYYSKSGLKPRRGWVRAPEPVTGRRVRVRAIQLPQDLRWSYLCRHHFTQERARLLGWCPP